MFVYLDIGFTLIGGPEIGPAAWLTRALGLPPAAKEELKGWLFTTPLTSPETLADRLTAAHGLDPLFTRQVVSGFWEQQIHQTYPLPGAGELLTGLKASGIPYGFITNIWTPFLAGFARVFPEEPATRPLIASCALGLAKPDAAIYRAALAASGVPAEKTIMIGDTYAMDLAPAMALGMKTVWLLHRPEKEKTDLVGVLNQELPRPDLTLAAIDALTPDRLTDLVRHRPQP
ncbi:MAG: HAD family hydrolase [Magnetococcales bacterium]|nr:HAD family hydrolase [Magnetococcales bacterium]